MNIFTTSNNRLMINESIVGVTKDENNGSTARWWTRNAILDAFLVYKNVLSEKLFQDRYSNLVYELPTKLMAFRSLENHNASNRSGWGHISSHINDIFHKYRYFSAHKLQDLFRKVHVHDHSMYPTTPTNSPVTTYYHRQQ